MNICDLFSWEALSAISTAVTTVIAILAYKKFLNQKVSEKQLDAVIKLAIALNNYKVTIRIWEIKDLEAVHTDYKCSLIDYYWLSKYSNYPVAISLDNPIWLQSPKIEIDPHLPYEIYSWLKSLNASVTINRYTRLDYLDKSIYENGLVVINAGGIKEDLYILQDLNKHLQFDYLIWICENLRTEISTWLKNKAGISNNTFFE